MILQGLLFVFLFGVLDVAICTPDQCENIVPVELNSFCVHSTYDGVNPSQAKSPVIFLHEITSNFHVWRYIYQKLPAATFRLICLGDLRNHGGTRWKDRSDVEAMTVDIENYMTMQNFTKVNLVGHGLGRKIAVHFALKYPEQVDSIVVEDMRPNGVTEKATLYLNTVFRYLQEALRAVPERSSKDNAKKAIAEYLTKKLSELGESVDEEILLDILFFMRFDKGRWQYGMNFDVLKKSIENFEDTLTPSSGLYNGPALFIYGTESPFDVGGDESNIRKLFPQAQLVPVAGAGHNMYGNYRQYMYEVVKFLNDI